MELRKFFNIRQASNLLGLKVRTIREWIHQGKINAVKYGNGKQWFISEDEIRRLTNADKD